MVDPTPVPTKKTDPTLGIAAHIEARNLVSTSVQLTRPISLSGLQLS
jgi:hypothetical protein